MSMILTEQRQSTAAALKNQEEVATLALHLEQSESVIADAQQRLMYD
jgi:hypothetical protein